MIKKNNDLSKVRNEGYRLGFINRMYQQPTDDVVLCAKVDAFPKDQEQDRGVLDQPSGTTSCLACRIRQENPQTYSFRLGKGEIKLVFSHR